MLADSSSRWKGVRTFAKSAGLTIDEHLVSELPDLRESNAGFEGGARATTEFLRRKRPFTAIMAFDDLTALGCIRALTRAGIKVPEQCSIIGFDDVAPAAFSTPALTTIRQPMEAMGTTAVQIVVDSIRAAVERRDGNVIHRKVAPELVVRESTRATS
jgi:LacI family transcriptional regulator